METTQQKKLLAALSQCVADRDAHLANIHFLLNQGQSTGDVAYIQDQFQKLAMAEITMEAIQMFYAKNFPLPENSKEENQ